MTTESFVVPGALSGERLDRALALLTGRPRSEIGRVIAAGGVTVSGAESPQQSRHLKEGELITVVIEELEVEAQAATAASAGEVSFEVVYVDDDVIVVDKPVGLVTHPGAGVHATTLVAGLLSIYPELSGLPEQGFGSSLRPGIVHRLDKETSGLLVVARPPSLREPYRPASGPHGKAHLPGAGSWEPAVGFRPRRCTDRPLAKRSDEDGGRQRGSTGSDLLCSIAAVLEASRCHRARAATRDGSHAPDTCPSGCH